MTIAAAGTLAAFLDRLIEFAEPTPADHCLDVAYGPSPVASALSPSVGDVTTVGIGPEHSGDLSSHPSALPYNDAVFSLVTARFSLHRLADPVAALREMIRVCHPAGRIVIADLARTNHSSDHRDALERVRDPSYRSTPPIGDFTAMIESAGATVTRLDLVTVERPAGPWLAAAQTPRIADHLREALMAETGGGPKTGARPRLIGGELWFTQTWAHIAAVPHRAR
ncbi:class I SAM-dependent methyltransferase [Actinocorallia longicatena]|uniref:Methyltransferase family protein n=1 Tax=Actinocorallia longicatena TaxID=111803 RepID=A0ABP6Q3I2_9ACTN